MQCSECGATSRDDTDSCAARFEALLALDHSRQEPWGSRHGQAFAAFALQHPQAFPGSLDHAWAALNRIYIAGVRPATVFETLRSGRGAVPADWRTPPRPFGPTATPSLTIADMGDFEAEEYPDKLDAWCRAALSMWKATE